MQNLKAVAMGVVAAISFFWPNRPNPAITVTDIKVSYMVVIGKVS
jgi:hypothetical protein